MDLTQMKLDLNKGASLEMIITEIMIFRKKHAKSLKDAGQAQAAQMMILKQLRDLGLDDKSVIKLVKSSIGPKTLTGTSPNKGKGNKDLTMGEVDGQSGQSQKAYKSREMSESELNTLKMTLTTLTGDEENPIRSIDGTVNQVKSPSESWVKLVLTTLTTSPNPLHLIGEVMRKSYAGPVDAPILVYLAVTSRLLKAPIAMSVMGESSSGKSYAVDTAKKFFTEEDDWHEIDAGSEKALIYFKGDLKHRTMIFAEADSIPDEGPAASAIRNLITKHKLNYDSVRKEDDAHTSFTVRKEGPTGLLTTSIKPVQYQLNTRMIPLAIHVSPEITQEIVDLKAAIKAGLIEEPDYTPFRIFQCNIREFMDRWANEHGGIRLSVVIPFAPFITMNSSYLAPRAQRDYDQLFSFIETHTLLKYQDRQIDEKGRLVATLEDYEVIRELVSPLFQIAAAGGMTPGLRRVIDAIGINEALRQTEISKRLNLSKQTVHYHVKKGIEMGYLEKHGEVADTAVISRSSAPLPEEIAAVLPTVEEVLNRMNRKMPVVQAKPVSDFLPTLGKSKIENFDDWDFEFNAKLGGKLNKINDLASIDTKPNS